MSKWDILIIIVAILLHFLLEYRAYLYGVLKGMKEEHKIVMKVIGGEDNE